MIATNERKTNSMIKKDLKCPRCGKTLIRGYSTSVAYIMCRCGAEINLKENGRIDAMKGQRRYAK